MKEFTILRRVSKCANSPPPAEKFVLIARLREISEFSTSNVIVEAALKPVPERFIPAESVDDFVKETDEVKRSVDRAAKE